MVSYLQKEAELCSQRQDLLYDLLPFDAVAGARRIDKPLEIWKSKCMPQSLLLQASWSSVSLRASMEIGSRMYCSNKHSVAPQPDLELHTLCTCPPMGCLDFDRR